MAPSDEYAAIKFVVIHLAKYMTKYLKGSQIRVNSISPDGILDKQLEAFIAVYKKLSEGQDMLDTVDTTIAFLFLIADASLYVNGLNLIIHNEFDVLR